MEREGVGWNFSKRDVFDCMECFPAGDIVRFCMILIGGEI
jgi:hypothetical protein